MPPERRANDADDNSQDSTNERRSGLRDRSKLKTTARNDDTTQPSSPSNRPTASNVVEQNNGGAEAGSTAAPINKIQKKIEKKQDSLQDKLQKAREDAEDKDQQDDAKKRSQAHQKRRVATALYEDYLYYQTPEYRKQYREDIDAAVKKRAGLAFAKGHAPAKLGDDETYDSKLRSVLKDFEKNGVGLLDNLDWRSMPPDQLRMRIPRAEKFPVGLGEQLGGVPIEPYNLLLDTDAIEKKRKEVEDQNKDPKMSESHSERRARETGLSEGLPTDGHANDTLSTSRDLRRTRLETGLFISAGETWDDWKTLHEREAPDGLYDELIEEEMPDDDSDSSDDENDLFAISYRECSGLAGCPRGSGSGGGGDDGGHDSSDDDDDGDKSKKKDNSDPVAPSNPAGGPPTGSKPRPKAAGKKAEKHDYTQYTRVQLRTAMKFCNETQSAKLTEELHKRAAEYDDNPNKSGAFHHYILKDKTVANGLQNDITKLGNTWSATYKQKLDNQNKKAGRTVQQQEADSEEVNGDDVGIDQTGEQVDIDISGENSPAPTRKSKSKKASTSKKKKTRSKRGGKK
ncbi:hypothetical protein J4E86_006994 [Alternaria arbusti]|uniref:uncharacterized protein n=1 Tax=Alternaria arbusti TaxID=232088 RepID=UPI002220EE0D|nr:uncharacterized protein J4E86_006994 [Alternaria arbusti]KAI4951578.1 hypothetical protein J4E86_006994 [Alternaria arbusti]